MPPKSPRIRKSDANSPGGDSPRNNSPRAPYNKGLINTQLKKRRSQGINPRMQKKTPSPSKKQPTAAQLLNNIPKAVLLTPSSSDNSLSATISQSGVPSYTVQPLAKDKPMLPPYLTLKRQQTAAMLNFRARKSVSQMDFKEARRTGNYQLVAHMPNSALVPSTANQQAVEQPGSSSLTIKEESLTKMLLQDAALLCNAGDGRVRFVVSAEQDVRIASLRIFNTIMLHAWRRRREEVRALSDQVEEYKRSFVKNRNQLHVYNSLFSVEKRRNESLNDQLKQSYRENAKTKLSYEELNSLFEQTVQEKQQLAKDNAVKEQDIENLQQLLQIAKNDLFHATTQQREQLAELTKSQREYQDAQFDKQELGSELELIKIELELKEQYLEQLRENLAIVTEQLSVAGAKVAEYKSMDLEIQSYGLKLDHCRAKITELDRLLHQKEQQVGTLQNCLAATVGQRIRQCFAQREAYQHATYRMLHFVAFYMLPGTPPPTLPSNSLPEAVDKLRGFFHSHFGGKSDNVNNAITAAEEVD